MHCRQRSHRGELSGARVALLRASVSEKAISTPVPSLRIKGHFRALRGFLVGFFFCILYSPPPLFFLSKQKNYLDFILFLFFKYFALRSQKPLKAMYDITVSKARAHGKLDLNYLLLLIYFRTRPGSSLLLFCSPFHQHRWKHPDLPHQRVSPAAP